MKSPKISREVLYVPIYLRNLSLREKISVALLVFISSITVGLMPIIYASIDTNEVTKTPIYTSEVELWRILGKRD